MNCPVCGEDRFLQKSAHANDMIENFECLHCNSEFEYNNLTCDITVTVQGQRECD